MPGTPEGAARARARRALKAKAEGLERRAAALDAARVKLEAAQAEIEHAAEARALPPVDPAASYPPRASTEVPLDGQDLATMAETEAEAGRELAEADDASEPDQSGSISVVSPVSDSGRSLPKNQELAENLMASAAGEAAALHIQVMRSRRLPAMVRLKAATTVLQFAKVGQDRGGRVVDHPAGMAALVAGLGRALAARASAPGADVVTVEPEPKPSA